MPARLALAAVAAVIAAGIAVQLHGHNLLDSAQGELRSEFAHAPTPQGSRAGLDDALDAADVRPGTGALFTAIGLEVRAKRMAAAERLALRATRREPRNFATWLTLGVVRQARGDQRGAHAAFARVNRLNPLYRTPR